jgi:hypothetical protein
MDGRDWHYKLTRDQHAATWPGDSPQWVWLKECIYENPQAPIGEVTADADAMALVAVDWNALRMPLSINYRCSKSVVRHAQTMVPDIEPWENAPEGSVETVDEFKITDFLPTDAMICRVNVTSRSKRR